MRHSSSIVTATRTEIWPSLKKVKGHPSIMIWTNLVNLVSLMLYTKIQSQRFLGSGEEHFKCFLPYMGMAAILLNSAEPFEHLTIPLWQETPCEIWWKLEKQFQMTRITWFYTCIKRSSVILRPSFELIWKTLNPRCYTPRLSLKAYLVISVFHIWAWRPPCSIVQNCLN